MSMDRRRAKAIENGNYAAVAASRKEVVEANRTIRNLVIALRFAEKSFVDLLAEAITNAIAERAEEG